MATKKGKATSQTEGTDDAADLVDRFETMLTRVTTAMSTTFHSCIEKLIAGIDLRFNQRMDVQSAEIFEFNKRLDNYEKSLGDLREENKSLKESVTLLIGQIDKLTKTDDDLEQYTRNDNLLFHGIPLSVDNSSDADLGKVIIDVVNKNFSGLAITESDISIAHRTGPNRQPQPLQGTSTQINQPVRPPPIVVRFSRRSVRNSILSQRKQLKGKNISITEQLTMHRSKLLKKASELVSQHKVQSAWSHDGRVLVKNTLNRIVVINSDADLNQF
jgi:hypothetical protein